jgi:hypothetical protein
MDPSIDTVEKWALVPARSAGGSLVQQNPEQDRGR